MERIDCCYKKKLLSNSQFINDYIWRPELFHRKRNSGDAVTLIWVPYQKLMLPKLMKYD